MDKVLHTLRRAFQIAWTSGIIVLGFGLLKDAHAANPETLQITVSVNLTSVDYGVSITSPEVSGYDFGQVNVAGTTVSTVAIVVTNTGNISEFFSIAVQDITPTYAWTNNGASLNPGTTSYVMQGRFETPGSYQPLEATFDGASFNASATPPLEADGKFNQGSGLAGKTPPGSSKDLWLRLEMPTGIADTGQHTFVLSINGQGS